uniref:Reverse transcriptase Ty1/copia-type domain-containing protein n=2 Tax=Micrurus spixii TaxID=129469 RepID=A0A2D4LYR6_9SAUR
MVPSNYSELKLYPANDHADWQEAIDKELNSLKSLDVYENARLPPGKNAIGCKWIYKLKTGVDGKISYKARLVAQGFDQAPTDYDEVFAPSLNSTTLRAALVWAAKMKN